ncbi:DUF1835 domain-containing protein [Rhodospirillaceae bacterium KN72]|uniref:DUF1835 domain-containing protein n=1 Tax=Pacificispira spongiicola TaxID=2729598 RepID=A0A7Y0DZJ4_9PROT|nr:DUF1835 domain-containing protein [Pacificispira spongiicola]NMM44494.1 DUF1835 domain-containing protein [Pacificispira spongiicola]
MRLLHIRCGEDIRDSLVEAGVPGDFLEWSDPICRGPVPVGFDRPSLRSLRSEWIASEWNLDAADCLSRMTEQDAALDRLDDYDRVILWFEHDLYDQATLIALLDRIGYRSNVYMITIDDHPSAKPRFFGLGQLAPAALASLYGTERPVTQEQVSQARHAYRVYREGNEAAIAWVAATVSEQSPLPFLPGALTRHLAELPGDDGLSQTERLTLQALETGAATPGECYRDIMTKTEPQPFLGDLMYWGDLRHLTEAAEPAIAPVPEDWKSAIALTEFGRAVLKGHARWTDKNTVKRWWGGRYLGPDL